MAYAAKTSVSVDRSQEEIKKMLRKNGAVGFAFSEFREKATVAFQMNGRNIKFVLPLPALGDKPTTKKQNEYDQKVRSKWRALVLCIKSKLECIESGITTFEEEFLSFMMLPNGSTVFEEVNPHVIESYKDNKMPQIGWSGK